MQFLFCLIFSELCLGALYSAGRGAHGTLGDGKETDSNVPVPTNNKRAYTLVAAGDSHVLTRTASGRTYAIGRNNHGQLGDRSNNDTSVPKRVMSWHNIDTISAGDHHTIFIDTDGTVFASGQNNKKQLGLGHLRNPESTPKLVDMDEAVKAAACGAYFTLLLTDNGKIWGTGENNNGQLGDGSEGLLLDQNLFKHAPGSFLDGLTITAISAGSYHTLFLTDDFKVYAAGRNSFGQLGNGTTNSTHEQDDRNPVQTMQGHKVVAISAGDYHSLFLTATGEIYATGYNSFGQLCDGTNVHKYTPVRIFSDVTGSKISGGGYHSVVMTDAGVYACGYNAFGQLGDGSNDDALNPVQIQTPDAFDWIDIFTGDFTTHLLNANNKDLIPDEDNDKETKLKDTDYAAIDPREVEQQAKLEQQQIDDEAAAEEKVDENTSTLTIMLVLLGLLVAASAGFFVYTKRKAQKAEKLEEAKKAEEEGAPLKPKATRPFAG